MGKCQHCWETLYLNWDLKDNRHELGGGRRRKSRNTMGRSPGWEMLSDLRTTSSLVFTSRVKAESESEQNRSGMTFYTWLGGLGFYPVLKAKWHGKICVMYLSVLILATTWRTGVEFNKETQDVALKGLFYKELKVECTKKLKEILA